MSSGVREPIAAGNLYEIGSQELRAVIDRAVNSADSQFTNPKVLVVPECGLSVAPAVCGAAMIMLETERDHVERVIVIGDYQPDPGERLFAGLALPRSVAFRTPLGDLLTDRVAIDALHAHPSVSLNDRPFELDSSIEVHLPPIQRLLGAPKVLPILVGDASHAEIVDVLERVWGGRETLILLTGSFARGSDPDEVSEAGERLRNSFIHATMSDDQAVTQGNHRTLAALRTVVSRRSMGFLELSSETIPDPLHKEQHIDIASFGGWESLDSSLAEVDARHLRLMATSAIQLTVLGGRTGGVDNGRLPPALITHRAAVVTLRRDGETRGSAGTIQPDRPLAASVIRNASAACSDPRLPSIQPAELNQLELTISVVSPLERIFPREWEDLTTLLEPGRHGVMLRTPRGRAAQLPSMWARHATHGQFIATVARKAELPVSDDVSLGAWYRFETFDY